jgi:Tfp pilus assembly protein PilF
MTIACVANVLLWSAGLALQSSPTAAQLLKEANESYRAMRSEDAVRLYREYLKQDPDNLEVRVYLGGALLNTNQPELAGEEAQRVLKRDKRFAKAHVLLGRVYSAENSSDLAELSFERALKLNTADRDALYFSGRTFYDANQFEKAIARFEQTLKLGATVSRTYVNLGLCYEALGQAAQAEESYRSAVQVAGEEYRPYFAYGVFLFKQSRTVESLKMLKVAFQLQPNVVDVRFELARGLYHNREFPEAEQVLQGALASNECRVHNLLIKILAQQGRPVEEEVKLLDTCLSTQTAVR